VKEGCDPAAETRKYEDLVGTRALATLLWTEAPAHRSDLVAVEIPVHVTSIDEGGVSVRFLSFPSRADYMFLWLESGHITALGNNTFLLDPCSANLEAWPEP